MEDIPLILALFYAVMVICGLALTALVTATVVITGFKIVDGLAWIISQVSKKRK